MSGPLPSEFNRICALYHGDNVDVLTMLLRDPKIAGNVDLVYFDPPFGTGRDLGAFNDRWQGGVRGLIAMLVPRLRLVHQLLNQDGSILVHVDPRAAPYLAVALDEIFGEGDRLQDKGHAGFRNELVWVYGLGGSSARYWPRKHDTILWYTKSSRWYFKAPKIPATSQRMLGQLKKQPDVIFGPRDKTRIAPDDPTLRAVGATDVIDVPTINNRAHERVGYPTQKPMALLELLLDAHCPSGGLVVDPFCGSGTTLAAARMVSRSCIGIDSSAQAIATSEKRLNLRARTPSPQTASKSRT
jgi:DNA modification methylase